MPGVLAKASMLLVAGAASYAAPESACRPGALEPTCRAGDHSLIQVQHAKASKQRKDQPLSWPGTGRFAADGQWCRGEEPEASWSLKRCNEADSEEALEVKVLTYNLFWWNLFGIRGGAGGSAGRLIAEHQVEDGAPVYYDLMAFQECDDVSRILQDARNAGLSGDYQTLVGGHALGIAYRSSRWSVVDHGTDDVAEDHASQWYGRRGAQWARLQHQSTGKNVTLVNHHGPLPVNTGGMCGGQATAFNILRTVAAHAHVGDAVVVTGDFNARRDSPTIPELDKRLNRVFTGDSMGGIDHIFSSSCSGSGRRLGYGGSDHEALDAKISV